MFQYTRKPDWKTAQSIDYDVYWGARGLHLNEKLKEREELMLARIPCNSKVLDIGCGNSRLPLALKEKGVSVEVADISGEVLKLFTKYQIPTIHLDLTRVEKTEMGQYDAIILSEVLEHTTNPEIIVQALAKHADRLFITIPNSAFYRYRMHLMFSGRFFTQWIHHPSEHLRYWSHIDFLEWLEAQDLIVEESVASNGFSLMGTAPFLKNLWKNLLGHQILYVCRTQ